MDLLVPLLGLLLLHLPVILDLLVLQQVGVSLQLLLLLVEGLLLLLPVEGLLLLPPKAVVVLLPQLHLLVVLEVRPRVVVLEVRPRVVVLEVRPRVVVLEVRPREVASEVVLELLAVITKGLLVSHHLVGVALQGLEDPRRIF